MSLLAWSDPKKWWSSSTLSPMRDQKVMVNNLGKLSRQEYIRYHLGYRRIRATLPLGHSVDIELRSFSLLVLYSVYATPTPIFAFPSHAHHWYNIYSLCRSRDSRPNVQQEGSLLTQKQEYHLFYFLFLSACIFSCAVTSSFLEELLAAKSRMGTNYLL